MVIACDGMNYFLAGRLQRNWVDDTEPSDLAVQ
jgi:hypothetical protein